MNIQKEDYDILLKEQWSLGDYIGTCSNCGRERKCECSNGMSRCEKCNWVEELKDYCPVDNGDL